MTVSTVLSIIAAVLAITRYFTEYAQQQKWIDQGTAAVILKSLQDSDEAIKRAHDARNLVRAHNASDPAAVLRDDDGFRRPSD